VEQPQRVLDGVVGVANHIHRIAQFGDRVNHRQLLRLCAFALRTRDICLSRKYDKYAATLG
jgi:hypothetical protein